MVATYLNTNEKEVRNNSGGLVHSITDLERLERFLILGTVGGTYYVNERDHTKDNIDSIVKTIEDHGTVAVDKIVEIGVSNRAPKHDPVLVAFAIAASVKDADVRHYALRYFSDVVRTGTHLFHFLAYYRTRGKWNRSIERAIAKWYTDRSDMSLANQLVKYKQRDGWSHRDALRLSHPKATSQTQNAMFKYVTSGTLEADDSRAHAFIEASIEASNVESVERAVELIKEFNLPREALSTKVMKDRRVWEALAPNMGLTALLRNLRNMVNDGYLTQGSDAVRVVRDRLSNVEDLKKSRIHPAQVFLAKKNAENVPYPIRDALDDTFYASFANVEPTNKRIMLALDVSGSMSGGYGWSWGSSNRNEVASPREWSALMAMVTARVEPYAEFRAFTHQLVPLNISRHDSLGDVIRKISGLPFGATDCSLPMVTAKRNGEKFDAFAVYTDNETNSGGSPSRALKDYRKSSGIHDAKLAVVGITATQFSIADPNDVNMLDFVGFDASAPAIMSDFIAR